MQEPQKLNRNRFIDRMSSMRFVDIAFIVAGIGVLLLFTTRYQMAFRLDDVLHIDWARTHTFFGAWNPVTGQIVRSFRPVFAATVWILSHTAGTSNYFPWHLTLVGSFLIGLAYAGKTSRYISERNSALYFTVLLYWIAFLPILNVLFWYGDLTFTIELMFITPAWYYGLRGLLEGRAGLLLVGIASGILAVMAKEPAIVLVHAALLGAVVLRASEVRSAWKQASHTQKILSIAAYTLFVGVTVWIYFASPTRANRFYAINASSVQLSDVIRERQSYYASIFLTLVPRLLIFLPVIYTALRTLQSRFMKQASQLSGLLLSLILAIGFLVLPVAGNISVIAVVMLLSLVLIAVMPSPERRAATLLVPFALAGIVTIAALSITIMIVKTQLTELAIVLLVISGWAWSRLVDDLRETLAPYMKSRWFARSALGLLGILLIALTWTLYPRMRRQEALLGNLRDVRRNTNDAIQWSAMHLPRNATLLVPDYHLYGIANSDALTQFSDSVKIHSQYTFHNGYVFIYLNLLGRPDIRPLFLEDSTRVNYELDSARRTPSGYLLLQSELDHERFHGTFGNVPLLKSTDSLVAKFQLGGFRSEVWLLR